MDIFNQNWTDQMKTNPLVNKLLNTDTIEVETPTTIHFWGPVGYGTKLKDTFIKIGRRHFRRKRVPYSKEHSAHVLNMAKKLPENMKPEVTLVLSTERVHSYHNNTRPQSLYNLRYACLR